MKKSVCIVVANFYPKISKAFMQYPHSRTYDCEYNFAPVTIFDINEMKSF